VTEDQERTGYYTVRFKHDPSRTRVWREIIRALERYLPDDPAVLELGPGYCDFINQVQARKKLAVDIDSQSVQYAGEDVEFLHGDCTQLGMVPTESMDLVFASNVLEHLEQMEASRALNAALRVLRPGGKLILIQPNFRYCYKRYYDDYTHVTPYTHTGLSGMVAAAGFRIVTCKPRFLPMSLQITPWIPKYGWMVRIYLRLPIRPLAGQMLIVAEKPANQ
jgi:ubiquinone/menaquinone biosynthesis C-methylase UbiE